MDTASFRSVYRQITGLIITPINGFITEQEPP